MSLNITSADITAVLTVEELFPGGIVLEAFADDTAISMDQLQRSDTRMGVDGKYAAGYIPQEKIVTVNLLPNSPALDPLRILDAAMETNKRTYQCGLVVTVPSINTVYTWTDGALHDSTAFPSAETTLANVSFIFHFGNYQYASIG